MTERLISKFKRIFPFLCNKEEKIYFLQKVYTQIYKDMEKQLSVNLPYFIKAEQEVNRIILTNKVNFEFDFYSKFEKYKFFIR